MSYLVRIFNHGQMTDMDLSDKKTFSVGSSEKDDYQIVCDGVKPHHMTFHFKGNVWRVKCLDNVTFSKSPIGEKNINIGDAYVLKAAHNIAFVVYNNENMQTKRLNISNIDLLTIGRNAENTIQFLNNRISGTHAKIYKKDETYYVEDMNSTNGTYVNNEKIKKAVLENNDVVSIGIYDIIYNNGELTINNASGDLNYHIVEEKTP